MPKKVPSHRPIGWEANRKADQRRYDQQRGTRQQRGYGLAWQRIRLEVLVRDLYECQICHKPVGMASGDAHVDHIVAKAKGGTDDLDNLRTLCPACHSARTVRDDGGFGRQPKATP